MGYLSLALLLFLSIEAKSQIAIFPTLVEVSTSSPIAEIVLDNKGDTEKMFEIVVKDWSQKNNEDHFQKTDNILVLPKSATIKPKTKQKFRVVLQHHETDKTQKFYRIFISEVLGQKKVEKSGLSFLLSLNVPLVSNGKDGKKNTQPHWSILENKQNKTILTLANKGNTYLVARNIIAKGKSEHSISVMQYVLPNSEHSWELPLEIAQTKKITIEYDLLDEKKKLTLVLPKKQYSAQREKL